MRPPPFDLTHRYKGVPIQFDVPAHRRPVQVLPLMYVSGLGHLRVELRATLSLAQWLALLGR
jgi:hypothetical protein